MILYPSDVLPEYLVEDSTAYIVPWGVYECQGKFYIPKELRLAPEPRGTVAIPVTRMNGVLVVGKGYDKPNQVQFAWLQLQDCIEVKLEQ